MAKKRESRLQLQIRHTIEEEVGGWFFKVHGSQFQSAGIPDLVGTIGGFFVSLEVKVPGTGKLSKIQKHTIKKIRNEQGIALIVESPEEAIRLVIR